MNFNDFVAAVDLYGAKNYQDYELVGASAINGQLKAIFTNGYKAIKEEFVSDMPSEIRTVNREEVLYVHF